MLLKSCNKKQKQERKNTADYCIWLKKIDCVEMLVSKSVMDGIIDHNEFLAIMKERKDCDSQKNEVDGSKLKEVEIVLKK